jgi:polyprenyldihydroxybenzoate methyltransferase/3-demethylubiquinol 3-O-methyltransferase
MNPLRHDFIRTCHDSQRDTLDPTTFLRFLDIGCGGGIFAESAARRPYTKSVTAIDPSPEVLAIAKAHARQDPGLTPKLTYLNISIEGLPEATSDSDKYDVVTIFEVIEHVNDPASFLDQVVEQLKPGGWLIGSTIARTWTSWLTTKLVAEDIIGIVPRGTHDWNKYINEDEMMGYFAHKGGFNSQRVMGVVYVPGVGWREISGSEKVGNYFFGVRKNE